MANTSMLTLNQFFALQRISSPPWRASELPWRSRPLSFRTLIDDFEQKKKVGLLGVQLRDIRILLDKNIQTFADLQNAWAHAPGLGRDDFRYLRQYLQSFGVFLKLAPGGLNSAAMFGTAGSLAAIQGIHIDASNFTRVKDIVTGAITVAGGGVSVGSGLAATGSTSLVVAFGAGLQIGFGVGLIVIGGYLIYEALKSDPRTSDEVNSPNNVDVGPTDDGVSTPEATLFGTAPDGVDPQQLVLDFVADPNKVSDGWDNGGPIDLGLDGSLPSSGGTPWGWGGGWGA